MTHLDSRTASRTLDGPWERVTRCLAVSAVAGAVALGAPVRLASDPADARLAAVANLVLPGVKFSSVETVAAGNFAPREGGPTIPEVPAHVRVVAALKPAPDSNIIIELWLPREGWNGRLLGTGNSGGAGRILTDGLAWGVKRGFATANTDLGTSPAPEAAVGHPDRWADFGHRATHEMTVAAKAIVRAYYGRPADRAYFVGSSTGGRQALMEAQRYPDDYDGIYAGSPANNCTHLEAKGLWNWQVLHE